MKFKDQLRRMSNEFNATGEELFKKIKPLLIEAANNGHYNLTIGNKYCSDIASYVNDEVLCRRLLTNISEFTKACQSEGLAVKVLYYILGPNTIIISWDDR